MNPRTLATLALLAVGLVLLPGANPAPASANPSAVPGEESGVVPMGQTATEELITAAVRLPLAAILGAILALRPRRHGTPPRHSAVVQTQIVLAVVGGVVMLIVGTSLARAFGIVGVASLIRYRSKIDDPKDAVVMLCALGVGLASGAGLYPIALFATFFLVPVLFLLESFEPRTRVFELSVKLGEKTGQLRPKVEGVLRQFKTEYELRTDSTDEVAYLVTAPFGIRTDRVSKSLTALVPNGKGGVEWNEIRKSKVQ